MAIFSMLSKVVRAWCSSDSPATVRAMPLGKALEQGHPQRLLEIVQALADGRRRDSFALGGPREVTFLAHCDEQLQCGEVDTAARNSQPRV